MYRLRELERADIPVINQWRNDKELIQYLGAPFRYINRETDIQWYEDYLHSRNNCVRCAMIDEKQPEVILGMVSLVQIDYIHRSAALHIMIGHSTDRGKGLGTFAVQEIVNHAFMNLNLHRIELEVLESNIPAQNLYKKCGFIPEGCKRQAIYKNGRYENMLIMAILKSDH